MTKVIIFVEQKAKHVFTCFSLRKKIKKHLHKQKECNTFAPSFSEADLLNTITKILKIQSNEQKNVSTIEKKKKK